MTRAIYVAAIREVQEETGLGVSGTIFPLNVCSRYLLDPARAKRWQQLYGPDVKEIDVVTFAAEIGQTVPKLDGVEHEEFGWFTYEDPASALAWPVESDALTGRVAALNALQQGTQLL
jgi:8-oxo-dGTP pyrophosphatase MutT (NUDIX family)